MAKNSVHILFVHGVGQHSQLSSLLGAYQALRSDVRSTEVPHKFDDLLTKWELVEFNQVGPPPYLKLSTKFPDEPGPRYAYVYEANYADLSGIIRQNQPLDITYLFISFDLAVNLARQRLNKEIPQHAHLAIPAALGKHVQRLAEVFVAATVPVLGLPSLVFRNYTKTWVGAFVRFFEDVATFSMDPQGYPLIAKHFNKTARNIVYSPRFNRTAPPPTGDTFVVVAHSLGTVVAHNYLLAHWFDNGPEVPAGMLTFGSPIGLVCWMWRFLDFPRMEFDAKRAPTGNEYFVWDAAPEPAAVLRKIRWMNVINHLDPIATAFPTQYVNLSMGRLAIENSLEGGEVQHRYIRTGGMFSAGQAHTKYFVSREFSSILTAVTGLMPEEDPNTTKPSTERVAITHWREAGRHLLLYRWLLWALGVAALYGYFWFLVCSTGAEFPYIAMFPYLFPRLTVWTLSFFQKLFFGRPTKRSGATVLKQDLRTLDPSSFPYRVRLFFSPLVSFLFDWILRLSPKLIIGAGRILLSFLPTLILMVLPLWLSTSTPEFLTAIENAIDGGALKFAMLLALFALYTVMFAASEFMTCWRELLRKLELLK